MTMPPGDYPDPMTQEVDLGYQRGWDDAMAQKSPCACGGKEPLARGYLYHTVYHAGRLVWGNFSTAKPWDKEDKNLPVLIMPGGSHDE